MGLFPFATDGLVPEAEVKEILEPHFDDIVKAHTLMRDEWLRIDKKTRKRAKSVCSDTNSSCPMSKTS